MWLYLVILAEFMYIRKAEYVLYDEEYRTVPVELMRI